MAAGDVFRAAERFEIDKAIRSAEQSCRFEFSVFVGAAGKDSGAYASRLHSALVAPNRSVLILVDPGARALEVVTGSEVRRYLTDKEVDLAVLQMQSAFSADDLVGGLKRGIDMLAEHARAPKTLHA